MPHTRSAKKNLRKSEKRRLWNRSVKSAIKTQIKKFVSATEAEGVAADQLRKEFVLAVKKLDNAAAKRIVHPNFAARKKSQLAKMLNQKAKPAAT